ncbi:MAG: hypothetical protein Q8M03_14970, partial [Legionella sp.]|nr:hypothetical protein [Legionella sp.]
VIRVIWFGITHFPDYADANPGYTQFRGHVCNACFSFIILPTFSIMIELYVFKDSESMSFINE